MTVLIHILPPPGWAQSSPLCHILGQGNLRVSSSAPWDDGILVVNGAHFSHATWTRKIQAAIIQHGISLNLPISITGFTPSLLWDEQKPVLSSL